MVVALDELIIFATHDNFPKRIFRAVEVLKVCKNMQKMTFLLFQVGMGYGVPKNDRTCLASNFGIRVFRSKSPDLYF